jgi:hypothetical protein
MSERRFVENDDVDLFEEYDIRINRNYTSLLLSSQELEDARKDHSKALPIKRIKTFPTHDYLTKYSEGLITTPDILPPGCRYIEKIQSGGAIVVIEEPPQFRTIAFQISFDMMFQEIKSRKMLKEYGLEEDWLTKGRQGDPERIWYYQLNLAFPYVIFILHIDKNYQITSGYTFLRINQMIGLSDFLLKMPLSNINDSQRICFGHSLNSIQVDSISSAAKHAVDVFWTSVFNTDYTYNVKSYTDVAGVSNYLQWQYLSRTDPMFVYRVDWIKMENNINYYIERFKSGDDMQKDGSVMYDHFFNAFTKPARIGEVITGRIRKKVEAIYYDIATGIYLSELVRFEAGDSFTSESGKTYHVVSFIGRRGYDPEYIRLSKDKKLFNFKLTPKTREYLRQRVEEERYIPTIKIRDDLELKPDDIICYETQAGAKVYKRVYYIRKSIDGKPEIRLGNQFYLAKNFPRDIERYDVDNPTLHDMKFKKGDSFIYARSNDDNSMINFIESCVFDSLDVGNSNNIILKFKSSDKGNEGRVITIDLNISKDPNYTRKIFPPVDKNTPVCAYPNLVALGRNLRSFLSYDRKTGNPILATVYKDPRGYRLYTDTEHSRPKLDKIPELIKNDKTFSVDTPFGYERFDIGDLVVAANWKDPLSVLNIKRIEGFKYENSESGRQIYFILMDKNGKLSQELVVFNEVFRAGYIRKIVTKYEDLESGTKIICDSAGFSNFPKKDINIVIGIIVDGPEPMVLCSNGCTLWYRDVIESFTQIPMGTDEWNEKQHVPLDPKKIKFQAGDIVLPAYAESGKEMGYLMVQNRESRTLKYIPLAVYTTDQRHGVYSADKSFQDECVLDSIPNPRITKAQQDKDGYIPGYFNFQGGVVTADDSHLLFVNDQRSFLNVSNSDK